LPKKHLYRGQGRKKINEEAWCIEFDGRFVYFSNTSAFLMGKTPSDGMNTTRLLFFLLVSLGLSLVATAQGIHFEDRRI
jgi:hypothetical protein